MGAAAGLLGSGVAVKNGSWLCIIKSRGASLVAQMVKESACNAGDLGSIPGLGRSPGRGHANPLFLPGESPWTEEPGRLQSVGSQRVGYD